jgi:hypothetical protein
MSVHYFTYCAKCGNESESGGLYCDRCNDKIYGDHSNCVITTAVCEHFGKTAKSLKFCVNSEMSLC